MADLSDNSPPKEEKIVVDTPEESVVDGENETPRSKNTRNVRVAKAALVDPLAPGVKLVLIQNGRIVKKPSFFRLNAKLMMSTRDSIRAQKPAKN